MSLSSECIFSIAKKIDNHIYDTIFMIPYHTFSIRDENHVTHLSSECIYFIARK